MRALWDARTHAIRRIGFALAAAAFVGCSFSEDENPARPRTGDPSQTTLDAGADAAVVMPPPPSDNVIDVAIWPRLVAAGANDLIPAPNEELCRRMHVDLVGAVPSRVEAVSRCVGKSAKEIARALMEDPRYVLREQRLWTQHLRLNPTEMQADYIAFADGIVARFARGEIGYDAFAAELLAHPVIALNRRVNDGPDDLTDVSRAAFRVFLGRAPLASEAIDFSHLYVLWRRAFEPVGGFGYYVRPAYLEPNRCGRVAGGCTSALLGATTTVSPAIADTAYLDIQGNVPSGVQAELEKPGRLLATRAEFWDEAVDHALQRLLGWWEASEAQPDTVLPEVRLALADWFRATPEHDVRALYEMILSSLLYTTTVERAEPSAEVEVPPWTMGPMKSMSAEQWLDSVAVALERPLGFCDMHTEEPVGRNWYWLDRHRSPAPTDLTVAADYYYRVGQELGGCVGAVPPASLPGMPTLLAQIDVGKDLCKAGTASKLVPPGFDPSDASDQNLQALVTYAFEHFLNRSPFPEEMKTLTETAATCLPDMSCGVTLFSEQLCGALLRSSSFYFY